MGELMLREIIEETAEFYGARMIDVLSERRTKSVVQVRHAAAWMAQHRTRRSSGEIGRALGGRDHTTVLHAIRIHQERVDTNPAVVAEMQALEKRIRAREEATADRGPDEDSIPVLPTRAGPQTIAEAVLGGSRLVAIPAGELKLLARSFLRVDRDLRETRGRLRRELDRPQQEKAREDILHALDQLARHEGELQRSLSTPFEKRARRIRDQAVTELLAAYSKRDED